MPAGRPRQYANDAERQKAKRARTSDKKVTALKAVIDDPRSTPGEKLRAVTMLENYETRARRAATAMTRLHEEGRMGRPKNKFERTVTPEEATRAQLLDAAEDDIAAFWKAGFRQPWLRDLAARTHNYHKEQYPNCKCNDCVDHRGITSGEFKVKEFAGDWRADNL